jgi:hypothetical protein
MLDGVVDSRSHIYERVLKILGEVSFGLNIVSIDVCTVVMQDQRGQMVPCWGIVYQAKGILIGPEAYVTNMTVINSPFIAEEKLKALLVEGCQNLQNGRMQQRTGQNHHDH